MKDENPALEALNNLENKNPETSPTPLPYIVNGIRTCGPLFAAALSYDSLEIDKDIDEMLDATKSLIESVKTVLVKKGINVSEYENSAINAFCIRVVAENWKTSQEVFESLVDPVVTSLEEQGISAEIGLKEIQTHAGEEITANIIVTGEIFSVLHGHPRLEIENTMCAQCIKEVLKSAKRAVEKLTQFHIPYEDAEAVSGHITLQAGNIFVAILKREIKLFEDNQRRSSMSDENVSNDISFETIFRTYKVAMNGFVDAIYVNSRMVS